ncbi:MAG: ABC transporter ATP-binding protein [Candidatus Doudnabacteria bacterium]|nr:ABC transporter ATP-binding protein [Candidatus Doudnabacteria bacterium]
MEKIIDVENLKKTFTNGRQKTQAIKGMSFFVNKGEIFGLLGPNGAGKTTTLEIIEGLKKQTEGTVKVLGFDNLTQAEEIKKHIGVQLQSSDYLPYLTLVELLNLFASLYKGSAKPNDHITLLKSVNLEKKQNEQVKNLSGGQKQRFTIATSLVHNPKVLFLDEPTTGLDPSARRDLWKLIKYLNEQGITIVLTTHYMEEAEYLCSRVAIMDQGQILETDEPKNLIDKISKTTQISFLTNSPLNENIFKNLPEIEKIYTHLPKIIIEIKSLDHISTVIDILKNNKVEFSGFTVKTASLEDVYLDLTGKEYQQ